MLKNKLKLKYINNFKSRKLKNSYIIKINNNKSNITKGLPLLL